VSAYDAIAEWYVGWLGPESQGSDPFWPGVSDLIGTVHGLRVCELACGDGRGARFLARQGAQVVGVDVSSNLLGIAEAREAAQPLGITYLRQDAGAPFDASTFDGVVCNLALMDIADLDATLTNVARLLRVGGWFVFSVLHPCFNLEHSGELQLDGRLVRHIRAYFDEGFWRSDLRTGPPGKVGSYHRTLSTYFNSLIAAGLHLERVLEPRPWPGLAERRPIWTEVPAVLVARCRKPAG
jgi:SAM-dependent methyltransferase